MARSSTRIGGWMYALGVTASLLLVSPAAAPASAQADGTSSSEQWTSVDLGPRVHFGSGALGTHVLVAGGYIRDTQGSTTYSDQVDLYDSATGEWSSAILSEARADPVLVSVGTQVLIAGGQAGGAPSSTVDIYDTETGQWSAASLSRPATVLTRNVATTGSQALFAFAQSTDVDVYDTMTGDWSTTRPPRLRDISGMARAGSRVLVWGPDRAAPAVDFDSVDVYDSLTQQWTAQATARVARGSHPVSVANQMLFVSDVPPNPIAVYDNVAGAWSTTQLPQSRYTPSLGVLGGQVLFVGGRAATSDASDAVDMYDAASGRWTSGRISQPRLGAAIVSVGSRLLVAGGRNANGRDDATGDTFLSDVEIFDGVTGRWSSARLSLKRDLFATAAVGTRAVFAGGFVPPVVDRNPHRMVATVDIYDTSSDTWSTSTLSQAREVAHVAVAGGQVLFIGGERGCSGCGLGPQPPVVDVYAP